MITLTDISSAFCRILPRYDVREAYLFGSFARGEQTSDSDIDLRFVCGRTMTFGALYELSLELEEELGRKVDIVTSPPKHMRPAFRENVERDEVRVYEAPQARLRVCECRPRSFPSKEPNPETLEAIREGDAFFATGECGRFDNGANLINAALNALEM